MNTVCLLGNGASIAYNPELSVGALTASLLQRFQEAGTGEAPEALARFARVVSGRSDGQFEALLGPLSMTAEALRCLAGITGLVQQADEASAAVATTSAFLAEVHRRGLAITLRLIADRSVGQSGQWDEVVDSLGRALADLGSAADLTVATLNYDGLTHSALMEAWNDSWGQPTGQVADLAWGTGDQFWDVVEPVKEAFRLAGSVRRTVGRAVPGILIVDLGEQATVRRDTLAEITGYPREVVTVNGAGLPAAISQAEWSSWASGSTAASEDPAVGVE